MVFSAGIATCAEAATLRHIPMIAPKKILPVGIFFPPRDLDMIALLEGQQYTFLPESRGEVKQNMELHGFTRPGSRDWRRHVTCYFFIKNLHNRAKVAVGKSKPF
jgi:hypothetical protein